jgi:hypothetical protein
LIVSVGAEWRVGREGHIGGEHGIIYVACAAMVQRLDCGVHLDCCRSADFRDDLQIRVYNRNKYCSRKIERRSESFVHLKGGQRAYKAKRRSFYQARAVTIRYGMILKLPVFSFR